MAKTLKATPTSSPKLVELPSLSALFTASWDRLKLVGWRLVGLYVLMSVVIIGVMLAGMLIGGGAVLGVSGFENMQASLMNPATWASLGVVFLALLIVVMFLANAFTGAIILAIDEGAKKTPFGQLLKQGFALIVPLFVVSLITQFLAMGGLFLFVIPGIVISVLLSFAMYEVVLANTRGMAALRNSASIVGQNFWGILGRWAALIGIQIVINLVFALLAEGDTAVSALADLISSLVSVFFGIYTLVYGVLLYRAARANTNLATGNITWMWPVAILGWVVGGALVFFIARAAGAYYNEMLNNPENFDAMMQEYGTTVAPEESFMYDGQDGMTFEDAEYGALYEQMMEDGEMSEEELNRLYQEALQLQQQPIE